VKQGDSEQNEVDGMKKAADSTGKVMHRSNNRMHGLPSWILTCTELKGTAVCFSFWLYVKSSSIY